MLQGVVDAMSELLGCPATLEDREFNLIAYASQSDRIDPIREASILSRHSTTEVREWFEAFGIATADEPVRTPADRQAGTLPRLCIPAQWRGMTYGYFWVFDGARPLGSAVLEQASELAAQAGALLAQQSRVRQDIQLLVRAMLSADPAARAHAASELSAVTGLAMDSHASCVVIASVSTQEAVEPIQLPQHLPSAQLPNHEIVVVAPRFEAGDRSITENLVKFVGSSDQPSGVSCDYICAVGAIVNGLEQLRSSWLDARVAARAARSDTSLRPIVKGLTVYGQVLGGTLNIARIFQESKQRFNQFNGTSLKKPSYARAEYRSLEKRIVSERE